MSYNFFRGDIVQFTEHEKSLGMPGNDFIVYDFYIDEKEPTQMQYYISDGGEKFLLIKSNRLVLSQSNKTDLQKAMCFLQNMALSLRSIASYHNLIYDVMCYSVQNRDEQLNRIIKKNKIEIH